MSPSTNTQYRAIENLTIYIEATTSTTLPLPFLYQSEINTTLKDVIYRFNENVDKQDSTFYKSALSTGYSLNNANSPHRGYHGAQIIK